MVGQDEDSEGPTSPWKTVSAYWVPRSPRLKFQSRLSFLGVCVFVCVCVCGGGGGGRVRGQPFYPPRLVHYHRHRIAHDRQRQAKSP